MYDQLADQTVVVRRDGITVIERRIHADTQATGRMVGGHFAGAGRKVRQTLGVDSNLDGMAVDFQIFLFERQRHTRGDADLFPHQILPKNRLGDWVFHLQTGVHFDEIELAILIEEFDGARTGVAHFANRIGTDFADLGALFRGDAGAGGFFKHLLVATLQRTIALA